MMKSPRSLYRPRRPATATGIELVTRRSPLNGNRTPSNPAIWFKNVAACEFGPTSRFPLATVDPPGLISSRVTVAGIDEGFVIAIPDCVDGDPSAYTRNATPALDAGRPA